jgi:hypothetical protein
VIIVVYEAAASEGIPIAADETLEVDLFSPSGIPWSDIAFSSTSDALKEYFRKRYPGFVTE